MSTRAAPLQSSSFSNRSASWYLNKLIYQEREIAEDHMLATRKPCRHLFFVAHTPGLQHIDKLLDDVLVQIMVLDGTLPEHLDDLGDDLSTCYKPQSVLVLDCGAQEETEIRENTRLIWCAEDVVHERRVGRSTLLLGKG
jgi:hypothetical protein